MLIDVYLRLPQIKQITGLSTSTIFRLEKDGAFPKRRKIGKRAVGWLESEVDEWLNEKKG